MVQLLRLCSGKITMVAIGNFLFQYRNALFPLAFIVLLVTVTPVFPFGDRHWDTLLDVLGILVALSGQILRFATIGYDYIKRGGRNRRIAADHLVTGGMFSHSRNPLYLGNILIFTGVIIILNAWIGYLVGVPLAIFIYAAIIVAEEEYLRNQFGAQYEDYCGRVNRIWPVFRGFSESVREMNFSWQRVIVKEYNTTFSWLAAALGLMIWENYAVPEAQISHQVQWLVWSLILLVVTYLIIRYLKSSRRLRSD